LSYVIAAYVIAVVIIGGYAWSIRRRRAEVERSLDAWGEADGGDAADGDPADGAP
jgi:CcmD family protein